MFKAPQRNVDKTPELEPQSPTRLRETLSSALVPELKALRNYAKWLTLGVLGITATDQPRPPEVTDHFLTIRINLDDPKYDLDLPYFNITAADIKDLARKPESIADLSDTEFEALSSGWEQEVRDVLKQQPTIPLDGQNRENEHVVYERQVAEILSVNNESVKRDLDGTRDRLELQKKINDYLKLKGFYLAALEDSDEVQVEGIRYVLAEIVGTEQVEVATPRAKHYFKVFKLKLAPEDAVRCPIRGTGDPFSKDIIVFPEIIDESVPPNYRAEFYRDVVNHEAAHLRAFELFTTHSFSLQHVNFEVPIGDSWITIREGLDAESFHEVIAFGAQMGRTEIDGFQHYLTSGDAVLASYQLYNNLSPYLVLKNSTSTPFNDYVLGKYYSTGKIDKVDAFGIVSLPIGAFEKEEINSFGLDMYRLGMAMMTEADKIMRSCGAAGAQHFTRLLP